MLDIFAAINVGKRQNAKKLPIKMNGIMEETEQLMKNGKYL
jgi:hypothetical protein